MRIAPEKLPKLKHTSPPQSIANCKAGSYRPPAFIIENAYMFIVLYCPFLTD